MFELNGVSKCFGDTQAIHPMDLSIPEGNTTVLIGQSGCGKSTLIRLMVGLVYPDTGHVQFEGEVLKAENVLQLRQKMGYVIQEGGLFPHLTARDNVVLMAEFLGWSPDQVQPRMEALAELTEFPLDGLDRFPGELS